MSLLEHARANLDQGDYVIIALVEVLRGGQLPAHPANVADEIGGGIQRLRDVRERMVKMARLGVLERIVDGVQVTDLGEQIIIEDVGGLEPSLLERERREREMQARSQVRS